MLGIHQRVEQVKDESTPTSHHLSLPKPRRDRRDSVRGCGLMTAAAREVSWHSPPRRIRCGVDAGGVAQVGGPASSTHGGRADHQLHLPQALKNGVGVLDPRPLDMAPFDAAR